MNLTKFCDSPAPANGGLDCDGDVGGDGVEVVTTNCGLDPCSSREPELSSHSCALKHFLVDHAFFLS